MCFSTSSCARLASDQIIGHGATEELVIVTELTTNGALGIPRGLVSTWGLVAVEAIFEPSFGAILAKHHPPDPNNLRNTNAPNSWFESGAHTFDSRHLGLQCRGFQKLFHATLELQSLQMVHKADVVCALPRATAPRLCRVRANSQTNCTPAPWGPITSAKFTQSHNSYFESVMVRLGFPLTRYRLNRVRDHEYSQGFDLSSPSLQH